MKLLLFHCKILLSPLLTLEHKYSDYVFWRHLEFDKDYFKKSKLWDAGRTIIGRKLRGYERMQRIMEISGKAGVVAADGTFEKKYSRDEDIVKRVLAVIAAISSNIPLAVLSDVNFRNYTSALDPKHKPPHHLETNRIIEVMIDYAMMEWKVMVEERRAILRKGFVSGAIDFWTDSSRKEAFGVFIMDMLAEKFRLKDGRSLFMSREAADRVKDKLVSVSALLTFQDINDLSHICLQAISIKYFFCSTVSVNLCS